MDEQEEVTTVQEKDTSPTRVLSTSLILKIFAFLTGVILTMGGYFKYVSDERVKEAIDAGNEKVRIVQSTLDMYRERSNLMEHKYDSLQLVIKDMSEGKADWYLKGLKVKLSNDNNTYKEVKISKK